MTDLLHGLLSSPDGLILPPALAVAVIVYCLIMKLAITVLFEFIVMFAGLVEPVKSLQPVKIQFSADWLRADEFSVAVCTLSGFFVTVPHRRCCRKGVGLLREGDVDCLVAIDVDVSTGVVVAPFAHSICLLPASTPVKTAFPVRRCSCSLR